MSSGEGLTDDVTASSIRGFRYMRFEMPMLLFVGYTPMLLRH